MKLAPLGGTLRFTAGCGAVAAAAALALPAAGSGATTGHCPTSGLRLKFVDSQGATGHRYIDYAFKNVGTAPCTLRGYPGAVLLNRRGHAISSAHAKVGHFKVSKVRTVMIAPGKRAFFTFTWVDGGFCAGSFTFYRLRVSPPANSGGFTAHLGKTSTCNSSARVSAVRPKLRKL